jgi:hypothetical protein
MASNKIVLSEKGFGSSRKGSSTILTDKNGEPLSLRLVTLPNGHIGGQCIVVPIAQIRERAKSFINTSEEVFEIKFLHQQNVGTISIRHFDANDLYFDTYEAGIVLSDSSCRIMSSHGMKNSEKAEELLQGILSDAWQAGLNRAFDPNPDKIYYGKLAMDGGFSKLEYFSKKK